MARSQGADENTPSATRSPRPVRYGYLVEDVLVLHQADVVDAAGEVEVDRIAGRMARIVALDGGEDGNVLVAIDPCGCDVSALGSSFLIPLVGCGDDGEGSGGIALTGASFPAAYHFFPIVDSDQLPPHPNALPPEGI